ncbi:MAG TPA: cation diffusion facilitator family transporter [Flavobacteriales bacterium]|nr:cation diffusion facilitator family transporter [Flavobacteriales bacterium]
MATNQSSKTVFLALSVNFFIAIVKTIISAITSSSAMFSEAIHSFVDSANQFILWFGIKQSKKVNKKVYPLGRGKEEYYWTLVVAVLIFTIGGLVSIEHGIEALYHPKKLENLYISIIVLVISVILESYVLFKAVKQLREETEENKSIVKLLKDSTDGPLIAIVVEDFAATTGLLIALVGTLISNFTGNPMYDAISSILIGLLLMISGLFLGYEMKHLITGESISEIKKDKIRDLISSNENILEIISLKIISIGTNKYLALISLDYIDQLTDKEIVHLNIEIRKGIQVINSNVTEIYFNPK